MTNPKSEITHCIEMTSLWLDHHVAHKYSYKLSPSLSPICGRFVDFWLCRHCVVCRAYRTTTGPKNTQMKAYDITKLTAKLKCSDNLLVVNGYAVSRIWIPDQFSISITSRRGCRRGLYHIGHRPYRPRPHRPHTHTHTHTYTPLHTHTHTHIYLLISN